MRTLFDGRFAPTTSSAGFLEVPLEGAASALEGRRRSLYPSVTRRNATAPFPEALYDLEPLTAGARPRELLADAGRWTGYFDNLITGTDAISAISALSETLGCQGIVINVKPHTIDRSGTRGELGAVQFALSGPLKTGFLNHIRSVSASFDGDRWVFHADGLEQWFEETEAYRARRIKDRFNSHVLGRYCEALGLDVFNPQTFRGPAVAIESDTPAPRERVAMTFAQTQEWLGIQPGMAGKIKG